MGSKLWRAALLCAVAASVAGQGENEPYFELSSARTFASNGKPTISVSSYRVDSLDFRVYRVDDPLKFFEQLESPHQFGGRAAPPPRERTALERFHLWKRSLRVAIRRGLRAQFTDAPSAHFRRTPDQAAPAAPGGAAKGTRYAETPLLNPQQLVLAFAQPVKARTRWDRQTVPIGVTEKGVYLVEAVRHDLRAYTILIVTDVAMLTKVGRDRIVNLVVDRTTGQPIKGVRVTVVTRYGAVGEAKTNDDGLAEIRPKAKPSEDLRVVALTGRDVAVNTLAAGAASGKSSDWMGYVYTDRPIYRPGHTVHFKGVLRLRTASGFDVPAGRKVAILINDPEDKPVYQKTLTASASGSIRDEFTLPTGASLGHYYIQVKADDRFMGADFQVEEYKKPEYEVRVQPARTRVLQGETVTAAVEARYYFGEPVANAEVKYAIYRERYYFPLWYDAEDNEGDTAPEEDDSGDQLDEKTAQLDAEGRFTVTLPTTVSSHGYDFRYRIEARVTDAAKREITGKGWVVATYGSFAVNAAPERYFYSPGATATIRVQARNYDSAPVRTRLHVELLQWNRRQPEKSEVKAATDVETGADGNATAALAIPAQGNFFSVRVTARTPEGRDVRDSSFLWASGGGGGEGDGRERSVTIVPDKKTYRAGDTAKFLIIAGQPNTPVWLTVEGRDLRVQRLVRSKDATVSFEVPLTAADEPGITVCAAFIRQGALFSGTKYVKVPPVEHQLHVALSTDKPQYQPGQAAEYRIDVTGPDGRPTPRAEFSLGVVDEAIYAIRRDSVQDILAFFFEREWNRVFMDSSLEYYFSGEAGKRRMRLAALRPPSQLAQLKPDRMVQPKVRKAFPDTAYWAADLITDAAGHARTRVDFPDSLTTWRATARAITPDTKVGSATLKTIVRKNLILRLATPRFFVQGDEVVISGLVHNYLAAAKTVRVSLAVEGLDLIGGGAQDVQVASRGEATVRWRVRARQVHTAKLTGKALTDEESDALELELPVNVPGVKLALARGGSMASGGEAAFDLTFPGHVQPGSRRISVRVSPSIAGSLFGALEFLTSFPYGCVEQTMSSFLPNVVVKQAAADLGLKAAIDEAALQEKIRDGLDRLYGFQHEDGGWGWWETDESQHFMTAYVVAGLAQAQAAGVTVKPGTIERGAGWLKQALARDPRLATDLRAYMVYALGVAGQSDPAAMGAVYERRSNLSPYGMALLGLALEQAKDPRAAELVAALEKSVQQDSEQAWWPASRDAMMDFAEDVSAEATAFATRFLAHQKRDHPLLPKAALWLMNHRNEGYWWSSTKQTAMVIYGLTDYLKSTGELKPNLQATVTVNGKVALTKRIEQGTALDQTEIVLDESQLQPGANQIHIRAAGEGRLYYAARAEYYSGEERRQKAGTVALNVLRDYFRLAPTRDGERILYDATPLNGPVATGDILAVRLTVTGSEWKYLLVEDPIPAGTEFIARDNVYQLRERPPWWQFEFTRRELHDDRLAIFQTWFPQGQRQYFYLLKVVNPGQFQVSPAKVQPMYQPGVLATSESRRLEVK
jgi:alpha-2-macroglobulin